MIVWIVLYVNYDLTTIKGAFSTETKAKAYRASHQPLGETWEIETFLLDSP